MAYTVSQAAKKSGVGSHALRFYDRQGLFPFMSRDQRGVRRFSEGDMECLKIIMTLKATGMKIKEIKAYLDLCTLGNAALEPRLQFMRDRRAEVLRQIEQLKKHIDVIDYKLWYYETAIEAGTEDIHGQHYAETGKSAAQIYREKTGKQIF